MCIWCHAGLTTGDGKVHVGILAHQRGKECTRVRGKALERRRLKAMDYVEAPGDVRPWMKPRSNRYLTGNYVPRLVREVLRITQYAWPALVTRAEHAKDHNYHQTRRRERVAELVWEHIKRSPPKRDALQSVYLLGDPNSLAVFLLDRVPGLMAAVEGPMSGWGVPPSP
jgi:hypothetical protein